MDENVSQLLIAILGGGGGGAFLLAIVQGLFKWISGSSHRERIRNTDLISQRTAAIEERNQAYEARQKLSDEMDAIISALRSEQEYSSILRRQLREQGITPLERGESL